MLVITKLSSLLILIYDDVPVNLKQKINLFLYRKNITKFRFFFLNVTKVMLWFSLTGVIESTFF